MLNILSRICYFLKIYCIIHSVLKTYAVYTGHKYIIIILHVSSMLCANEKFWKMSISVDKSSTSTENNSSS